MDRRQNNGSVKAVSPRHCPATSAPGNCCFNCRAGQSHKDNVRCTAVEEQPDAKEVQLSQPSSTSLLTISSGLRVQLHLPPLALAWNPVMTHTGVCMWLLAVPTVLLSTELGSPSLIVRMVSVDVKQNIDRTVIGS